MRRHPPTQRPEHFQLNPYAPLSERLLLFLGGGGGCAGTAQAFDSSDNPNHGTLTNMTPSTAWYWSPELGRMALTWDGADDHIVLARPADLLPTTPKTYCAWVKADPAVGYSRLWSFSGGVAKPFLDVSYEGKPLYFGGTANYRYWPAATTTKLKDGEWHHLALYLAGTAQTDVTSAVLYLDGQAQAPGTTVSSGAPDSFVRFQIGTAGSATFDGDLSDPMVFEGNVAALLPILSNPSDAFLGDLIMPRKRRVYRAAVVTPPAGRGYLIGSGVGGAILGA